MTLGTLIGDTVNKSCKKYLNFFFLICVLCFCSKDFILSWAL